MVDKLRSQPVFSLLVFISLLSAGIILLSPFDSLTKFFFILLLGIFSFSALNYQRGFFLFMFLRPVIDMLTNQGWFSLGGLNINIVFSAFMAFFALIVLFDNFRETREKTLLSLWLIFMAWSAYSLTYSFDISESLKELARYASIVFSLVLGATIIRTSHDLTKLIKVIIWSALFPALVALYQFWTDSGWVENGVSRLYGTMIHPNMLAFYLLLSITLSMFIFLTVKKSRLEAYIYLLLALFFSFILAFTYTRGAYLALLLIILLVGFFKFRKLLFASALLFLILYLSSVSFQDRFNTIFRGNDSGSIAWRWRLYSDGYSYAMEHPVHGYGVGLSEEVIARNRDFRLGATQPHNDYLRLALEGGFVSLSLYILLILVLMFRFLKFYRLEKRTRLKIINIFIFSFACSLYLASFGDNILSDTALEWHFWTLVGAILAVQARTQAHDSSPEPMQKIKRPGF